MYFNSFFSTAVINCSKRLLNIYRKNSKFRVNNSKSNNRSIRLNNYPTIIQLRKTPFIVIIGSNVWTCHILKNFRNYHSKWFFLFFLQSTTLRVIHLNDEVFRLFPTKGWKSKRSVARKRENTISIQFLQCHSSIVPRDDNTRK